MKKLIIGLLFCSLIYSCTENNNTKTLNDEITKLSEQIKGMESDIKASKLQKDNIQHTVQFNLKWDNEAPEVEKFLQDGKRILSALPMVHNFEVLRQVGSKNNYKYYFTMVFKDQDAYEAYKNHPEHVKFVKERWDTEVSDFLEADFVTLD